MIQKRHIWKETSWMTPAASYKTELYSFVRLLIVKTFFSSSFKESRDRTSHEIKDDTFSSNFHYSVSTVTPPPSAITIIKNLIKSHKDISMLITNCYAKAK